MTLGQRFGSSFGWAGFEVHIGLWNVRQLTPACGDPNAMLASPFRGHLAERWETKASLTHQAASCLLFTDSVPN